MRLCLLLATVLFAVLTPAAHAVDLFTEDFEVDPTANWTINDGPTDEHAEFFFDYSMIGVPPAPNSGGTTRGMRLRANLIDAVFGGFSVSPNGQSFTGDYKLTFDLWHNYLGGFQEGVGVIGTTPGSTMLSLYGIETAGTTANYPGAADSIFFANTGDISSSAFRAYSAERAVSYQLPIPAEPPLDNEGNPIDGHATYHAGTRSNTPATGGGMEVFYQDAFPSVTVPAAQTALYPDHQFGSTVAGSVGFDWHEVEIAKVGTTVTWKMNGVTMITLETEDFVTPTAGTNILFGHSDINAGVSFEDAYLEVAFTLIDNIKVSTIDAPGVNADFNGNGTVDAADYVVWRKNSGLMGGAAQSQGDANADGNVDSDDYDFWRAAFGNPVPGGGLGSATGVPEPGSALLGILGLLGVGCCRRQRS